MKPAPEKINGVGDLERIFLIIHINKFNVNNMEYKKIRTIANKVSNSTFKNH